MERKGTGSMAANRNLSIVVSPTRWRETTPKNVGMADFLWDEDAGRSLRGVRRESIPADELEEAMTMDACALKRGKLRALLQRMDAETKVLSKSVKDNTNTKKEIKEQAKTIRSLATQIATTEMLAVIAPPAGPRTNAEAIAGRLREEVRALREEVGRLKACQAEAEANKADVSCQTERRGQTTGATIKVTDGAVSDAPAGSIKALWVTEEEVAKKTGGVPVQPGTMVSLVRTSGIAIDGVPQEPTTTEV